MNRKYDRYDYVKDASGFVERLGESIMSYRTLGDRMKAGTITEIVDKTGELDLVKAAEYGITDPAEIDRLKKVVADFKEAEEKYIKASLSEYNMSSVITEELNYKATFDKTLAEKDPKKYMYAERQSNGVIKPMPTPEQEAEAENFMRNQMRQMIDKKLNIKPYTDAFQDKPERPVQQPTEATYARMGKQEKATAYGSILGKLYGLPYADKEGTLTTIKNLTGGGNANFGVDNKGDTYILLENKDGTMRQAIYYTKNGEPVPLDTFVEQAATFLSGFDDIREFLPQLRSEAFKESRGGVLNRDFGDSNNRSKAAWTDKSTLIQEIDDLEARKFLTPYDEINLEYKKKLLAEIEYRDGGSGGTTKTTTKPAQPR
jgi:hypothetical protein